LEAGARLSTGQSFLLDAGGEPSRPRLLAHLDLPAGEVRRTSVLLDKPNRNALFQVITHEGFDPRDFELDHDETRFILQHRSWGDVFMIHESPRGLLVSSKVGDAKGVASGLGPVEHAPPVLGRWLEDIKMNQETPDLWDELGKELSMSDLMEGQENTPFAPEELERITDIVDAAKRQAKETYGLPDDQLRLLGAKLDYLIEVAPHSRRIDWLNTAVGAVAGAFAGGLLTPDVVHKVLTTLNSGLGPLFGHPMPMIGP